MITNSFVRVVAWSTLICSIGAGVVAGEQQQVVAVPPVPISVAKLKADSPDRQLFFCTTRIEAKNVDGKSNSIGTGFVFFHKVDEHIQVPFVVTCRHVVHGYAAATFSFVRDKEDAPELGHKCEVTVPDIQGLAFYDPDPKIDVALIPFMPLLRFFEAKGEKPFFRSLSADLVPNVGAAEDLSAIQSVVFVGYPNGMRDEHNLLPIARRGYTASPYVVDFNGLPLFLMSWCDQKETGLCEQKENNALTLLSA